MDNKNIRYSIASVTDRENLVLEIFVDNKQILEISKEPGHSFELEIFPPYEGDSWKLDFLEFKRILDEGIRRFEKFYE